MRLVHFNLREELHRVRDLGPVDSYWGLKFIKALELQLIF
jgi:hypothetical protein